MCVAKYVLSLHCSLYTHTLIHGTNQPSAQMTWNYLKMFHVGMNRSSSCGKQQTSGPFNCGSSPLRKQQLSGKHPLVVNPLTGLWYQGIAQAGGHQPAPTCANKSKQSSPNQPVMESTGSCPLHGDFHRESLPLPPIALSRCNMCFPLAPNPSAPRVAPRLMRGKQLGATEKKDQL